MDVSHIYLSPDAEAYLRLYCPKTYGVALPKKIADQLMVDRLVEWVPAPSWSGTIYALTDRGAQYLDSLLPREQRP